MSKPTIDQATVDALATAAFGPEAAGTSGTEITGGTYNTVLHVKLGDGRQAVLKIAPTPATPRLTYERDILRTEAVFYTRAAALDDVPTPRVLAEGFDRTIVPSDYLFMTAVPGQPLEALRADLSQDDLAAVRRDLGRVVAALHTLRGEAFGYPEAEKPSATWAEAFIGMVESVLADADRLGTDLPGSAARIRAALEANLALLDDVRTPVLVHFDLWDGNVLVARDGDTPRLGGIVDGERAFWGDPYADFVSLALFGDIESDADFLAGYRAAGGTVHFTSRTRRRISMYRVYLYLIMLIEGRARGHSDEHIAGLRAWLSPLLARDLAELTATPDGESEHGPATH